MALHLRIFLSPVDASLDGLYIYLVLLSVALIGVGWRGGFSYHMFTPTLWRGCHLTIRFFFYKDLLQTSWNFGEKLRTLLHSWGSPFQLFLSSAFQRRLQSHRRIYFIVFAQAGLIVLSDLLGGLWYFCHVVWSYVCLFGGSPVGSFLATWYVSSFRDFPIAQGLQNFRRDCFAPAHNIPASIHLALCFTCTTM